MSDVLRVGLPLPLDTVSDLLGAIRSTWPAATIVTRHSYGSGVMVIDLEGGQDERHD